MFNLSINNIDKIKEAIKNNPKDVDRIINQEFQFFGVQTRNDAVEKSPINEGALRQSINDTVGDLSVTVGAYIEYAAFIEFGTKKFAEAYVSGLPDEWQTFASQFQGKKGGAFAEMLVAIKKWVQLKGLASGKDIDQAAYLIARKILVDGIHQHPFLYPAFEKNKQDLIDNLKAALNVK